MKNLNLKNTKLSKSKKGFTLVELLLSIALFSMIAFVSVPIYQTFLFQNDLIVTTNLVINIARSAQLKSQSVQSDSVWGVSIQTNQTVLFKGATYATRDTTADEVSQIMTGVVPSGLTEFTFSKVFGEASTTGSLVLTGRNSQTKTLTLNAKGVFSY